MTSEALYPCTPVYRNLVPACAPTRTRVERGYTRVRGYKPLEHSLSENSTVTVIVEYLDGHRVMLNAPADYPTQTSLQDLIDAERAA